VINSGSLPFQAHFRDLLLQAIQVSIPPFEQFKKRGISSLGKHFRKHA
jgi:hypothetical protein